MDLNDRILQLEKEKRETLEQHAKRPCIRGSSSSKEEEEEDRNVQLEKEKQETLEQHDKRPCIRGSTSSKEEEEEEEEEEEKVVEDTAASDKEEEMVEETKDDTDLDEYELVEPRRFMTDEEILEHRRQVIESKGFDVEKFEGRLPGSIKPYTLTESRSLPLIGFSKQALEVYNKNNNTNFEFYELKKANSQGVAGVMFYITFEAISGNTIGTFRARHKEDFVGLFEKIPLQKSEFETPGPREKVATAPSAPPATAPQPAQLAAAESMAHDVKLDMASYVR